MADFEDQPHTHHSTAPLLQPLPRRPYNLTSTATPLGSSRPESPPSPPDRAPSPGPDDAAAGSTLYGIYAQAAAEHPSSEPSQSGSAVYTPWGTGAESSGALARGEVPDLGAALRERMFARRRRGWGVDVLEEEELVTGTSIPPTVVQGGRDTHLHKLKPKFEHLDESGTDFQDGFALWVVRIGRGILLFGFGLAYGALVERFQAAQSRSDMSPMDVGAGGWAYLAGWGGAGVALGTLLPVVDGWWGQRSPATTREELVIRRLAWEDVIRSVGAFVGVAFAIRKTPWTSTLQVSLTLALANPALWYLLDRSKPGLLLSLLVGLAGTVALLAINPALVPVPPAATELQGAALWSGNATTYASARTHPAGNGMSQNDWIFYERIGTATWIASVLFCSCVCFGNIGRRLALPKSRTPSGRR